MSERKVFKMYLSYFEVAEELNDKDRLKFYDAIMKRQFFGEEPNFTGMLKLAWVSQKHSIDKQIEGFETKTGVKLTPRQGPIEGPTQGGRQDPSLQIEIQLEEQEQLKEEKKEEHAEVLVWPSFDDFWDLYDKKRQRDKCEKKWQSLSQSEKVKIIIHIPEYLEFTPDKQFRKDPLTFLNNRSWEDEIIKPSNNGQGQKSILGLTEEERIALARNKDI